MAIQDRNLSVGTQLYARYKGQTHTAEVVEVQILPAGMLPKDAPGDPDPRLVAEIRYRLSDGREFKSPSAAGTAVTGKACNGWAFWSVGDGGETTGPVRSTTTRAPRTKAQPAPKPEPKRRGRKARAEVPPASDAEPEPHANGADFGNPGDVHPEGIVCHACGETFPSVAAATEHYYATHGKPEGDEPTA
jgi:hypothetical protein